VWDVGLYPAGDGGVIPKANCGGVVMTSLHDAGVETRQRALWVDNLRVLTIAGVIVVHTATGYVVDIAGWYYDDERTTSEVWSTLLSIPVLIGALFALGPLFLVAGWFSARSLARRGPAGFVRSRLVRLGVPLLLFVLVVERCTDYVGNFWDESRSFASCLRDTEVSVMWFVAALLVFSLVYAAVQRLHPGAMSRGSLRPGVLVTAGLTIAVSSFGVWLVWPLDAEVLLNLRLGAWPQGAVLFALGVHAAGAGWLEELPPVLVRRLGWMAAAGIVAIVMLFAVELGPRDDEKLAMAADWPTMLFALLDGVIAVALTLWFVAWVQRRWPSHGALLERAGRASYATYFIHPLVLTAVMILFASVLLAPVIKFVLVAAVAIPACFAAGYTLTRLPGFSKVL
jgi:glucan biosynthesis protein C